MHRNSTPAGTQLSKKSHMFALIITYHVIMVVYITLLSRMSNHSVCLVHTVGFLKIYRPYIHVHWWNNTFWGKVNYKTSLTCSQPAPKFSNMLTFYTNYSHFYLPPRKSMEALFHHWIKNIKVFCILNFYIS